MSAGRDWPLIILSGAYCSADIAAEFGYLPPSFLPAGGGRLYERQARLGTAGNILLTIPSDYAVPAVDMARLAELGISLVRMPAQLSLVMAMSLLLEMKDYQGPVRVLFGDSLFEDIDHIGPDQIAVQSTNGNYRWCYCEEVAGRLQFRDGHGDSLNSRQIVAGYFVFAEATRWRQSLHQASALADALQFYADHFGLRLASVGQWHDFGHLVLLYQSVRNLAVTRAFNRTQSDGRTLTKRSSDAAKIKAEVSWYQYLPERMRLYAPRFLGQTHDSDQPGYTLEYLHYPLLSDLYCFGALPLREWNHILNRCFDFLDECRRERPPADSAEADPAFARLYTDSMLIGKTRRRLSQYLAARNSDPAHVILEFGDQQITAAAMLDELAQQIRPTTAADVCLSHGDFFFGNLFYDSRADRIIAIDPRGYIEKGLPSYFGDYRYDLAKLAHSVIGQYDRIINNRMQIVRRGEPFATLAPDPQAEALAQHFITTVVNRYAVPAPELLALTASLFFAMLPLHAESPQRQAIFFANGLRLYHMMRAIR